MRLLMRIVIPVAANVYGYAIGFGYGFWWGVGAGAAFALISTMSMANGYFIACDECLTE